MKYTNLTDFEQWHFLVSAVHNIKVVISSCLETLVSYYIYTEVAIHLPLVVTTI